MKRRKFIVSVPVGLALAGYADGGGSAPIQSPTDAPTEASTPADTEAATDSPTHTDSEASTESRQADVVIGEGTYDVADFGFAEYPYFEVELANRGDARSGIVELVVDWFDEGGNYVDDTTEQLVSLEPGETWIARSYNVLNNDEVASAEGSGSYDYDPPEWPAGLKVASSQLLAGEENVKVRATVQNDTGQTVDYVAFYGKLYDADGRALGQVWTNESNLAQGSSWRAEREWDDEPRAGLVESHEVILEGSIY